jgi:hypothetical protein
VLDVQTLVVNLIRNVRQGNDAAKDQINVISGVQKLVQLTEIVLEPVNKAD